MIARRAFLASMLAAGATPHVAWADAGNPRYIAAARDAAGAFALVGLTEDGTAAFRVALPARGHAGAGHPLRAEAVVFARRPGAYALVMNCATGAVIHRLTPPEGRQLNGHGVYARGGRVLVTVEQMAATSDGVLGFWDASRGYARMAEVPTHGIGPHDIRLMPDGTTLVVANGGIVTDPTDRTKLNIDRMQPNLAYLDLDGAVVEQVTLEQGLHQNSIRHLALREDGLLAFAMQWEGEQGLPVPLMGLHRRGGAVQLAAAPEADEIAMQGYAGSIAFSGNGAEVAITSPRGGRLHRFTAEGAFVAALSRADICGVSPLADGFLASDGLGGLIALENGKARAVARHDLAWDNHLIRL